MNNRYPEMYFLIILFVCGSLLGWIGHPMASTESIKVHSKLAVLPFENLSGQFGASDRVMAMIVESLQKEFDIIPESQVIGILSKMRVRHSGFLSAEQLTEIGRYLKVKTVLVGIIDTYRLEPLPQASFYCQLISTKNDTPVLWSKYFCAAGHRQIFLFQRDNQTEWQSIMQSLAEDLVQSIPKNGRRISTVNAEKE